MWKITPIPFLLLASLALASLTPSSRSEEAGPAQSRGFLGFQYAYEESADESPEGRFRVRDLYPGGPAEKAGLRVGDLIVAVNGVRFRFDDQMEIHNAFAWLETGADVEFSVLRDGSPLELTLVAVSQPSAFSRARPQAERQARADRGRMSLYRLAAGDGVEILVIRDGGGGFRAEIPGVEPELRRDIADFVGKRYLAIFGSSIREGDRFRIHFQARPPEPGADPEDLPPQLAIRFVEAPPHVWPEESEAGAEDAAAGAEESGFPQKMK